MKEYPFQSKENSCVDKRKLVSLIQMVFEPLNEAELIRLSTTQSERTGYKIDTLFEMYSAHNQNNPKMMRDFYNKIYKVRND